MTETIQKGTLVSNGSACLFGFAAYWSTKNPKQHPVKKRKSPPENPYYRTAHLLNLHQTRKHCRIQEVNFMSGAVSFVLAPRLWCTVSARSVVGSSEQLKGDETVSKQQYVVKITSHYQNPPLVLGKYYFDTEQEAENFISTLRPASKSSDVYQMALTFELLELWP